MKAHHFFCRRYLQTRQIGSLALFTGLTLICTLFTAPCFRLQAQAVISTSASAAPNPSAMLDIQSTAKGLLIPRMTTAQRIAIATPARGLLVFDTSLGKFFFCNSAVAPYVWVEVGSAGAPLWTATGANVYNTDTGRVGIGVTAPAAKLDVLGGQWNLLTTEGDFRIGKGDFRLKIGVATEGSGAGDSYILAQGGMERRLFLGSGTATQTLTIRNGRIGINTEAPSAPLHVEGSVSLAASSYAYYRKNATSCTTSTGVACLNTAGDPPPTNVSIYASNVIRAFEFNAFSDARIKRVAGPSDPINDLATLNCLRVTDYRHIDVVGKGAAIKKGFIAQEVEQVFPEAVSLNRDFVPDCYRMAGAVRFDSAVRSLTLTLDAPCTFVPGDHVRLIGSRPHELTVTAVAGNAFTVSDWPEPEALQVFVFGKQVDDFRTVDYDRIFTLGISAMQELTRENGARKAENDALKTRLEQFDSENTILRADVETLKSVVFGMAKK